MTRIALVLAASLALAAANAAHAAAGRACVAACRRRRHGLRPGLARRRREAAADRRFPPGRVEQRRIRADRAAPGRGRLHGAGDRPAIGRRRVRRDQPHRRRARPRRELRRSASRSRSPRSPGPRPTPRARRSIVWGSSYSAALAFVLAAAHPGDVSAIVAFSPGEYLAGKQTVRSAAAKVDVPVWIDQASSAEEIARSAAILKAVKASDKHQFSAKVKSTHGSSTLRADSNPTGAETHWQACSRSWRRFRGA